MERLKKNLAKAEEEIVRKKDWVKTGKMRQKYHFMAESGWINDPNGLIFFQNKYHFFYQYNPFEAVWGTMHWGHAVSTDMIHWEYLPVALAPSEPYDNHPKGGCFSGSAIEHEGRLYLFYTGKTDYGDGFVQAQCMAYSDDGIAFKKASENPVIPSPPPGYSKENFRDPKVWKHDGKFYMICGGQKDHFAAALLYRSTNLTDWEYVNVLAESRGELGCMWECPDFYPIGNKYVLMFSPMGLHDRTTVYLVGDMNYETGKFIHISSGEIDWGFDYYAPQSFVDATGRRLVIGWANAWDWMPWFKDWGPTHQEGWCGSFNLPREVILRADNTLQFKPIAELKTLRCGEQIMKRCEVGEQKQEIPIADGTIYEMQLSIDLQKTTAKRFDLLLRADEDRNTLVSFDLKRQMVGMNRSNADGWSTGATKSTLFLTNKKEMFVHIFSDQSSIELFTDDYRTNHSCNVFPREGQNKNYIAAYGGTLFVKKIKTWQLRTSDKR